MKLLYYSPSSYGGLADYAHEQAGALDQLGIEVTLLCTPDYLNVRSPQYKTLPILRENAPSQGASNKVAKAIHFIRSTLFNFSTLARITNKGKFQHVLLGSYIEYLAPLWSPTLRKLAKGGVCFGAIVHDPVRDFVLGPMWWHRRSIAAGYSFLSEAFVHEAVELETIQQIPRLQTTVIPHGPYHFSNPTKSADDIRAQLQIPQSAQLMLAFGHIRANKNLDLVIKAMAQVPNFYLLVAGKALKDDGQNLIMKYQKLAKKLKVSHRCRWENKFIPEESVANFFQASDLVLLTYDRTFHSASGVLSTAAGYRKPCLVSAGEGPLQSIVKDYKLGIWVEPDDLQSLVKGLNSWLVHRPQPNWTHFLKDNSWQRNAELVANCFGLTPAKNRK